MAKSIMITAEGLKQLEEELDILKGEKRKEIAEKIKVARSYGDLSENSEYDDAKNEQAILEARIATIEATLKVAVVIDENEISSEIVRVGSKVRLENITAGKEVTYRITGSNEANPREFKISDESPVGKGLLGHKVGDVAEIETPAGVMGFKVLEILK
ncbi:MAG: transcription elongation factor GreA [Ruminococcus sp.]|nr:transcription elongation factor GreA [Ruminococcus sp.]